MEDQENQPEPQPEVAIQQKVPSPATWGQGAFIILLLMWISVAVPVSIAAMKSTPVKWEYTMFLERDHEATEKMNKAGLEGWEIVSVRRVQSRESDMIFMNEILVKRPVTR